MASDADFLETAKKRFKLALDASQRQREREKADIAFYSGEQWSPDALKARQAQQANNDIPFPAPARPALVINLVRESVRQVLNQELAADYAIELVPADDFAGLSDPQDSSEIELREGITRRLQRESEAEDARTWAGARAAIAGAGYYGVMTRYLPGKTFDQEIYIQRIYDQSAVLLDPAHTEPDGSDAEWGFITNDYISFDEYKATWPRRADGTRNRVATTMTDDEFNAFVTGDPEWFRTEGTAKERYCRIADYWYVERTVKKLVRLLDGSSAWEDEVPPDAVSIDHPEPLDTREVITKTIKWCKLDGQQVLEQTDWPGQHIPIIKVLGEELQPYDQERRAEGMVRPSRDAQTGFNAMISKWVETIGLSPIPPFQATPDQIQGFEKWYQYANVYAAPYLPYNLVSDGGKPLGPPTRTNIDTPIQALAASVQLFRDAVQSTTGIHDPQLGKVDPSLKSGRAIQALQQQSTHGTSNFLDNLKRSIRYEGQIINGLLAPIYGTPGRVARILNKNGEAQTVTIGNGQPGGAGQPGGQKTYQLTPDASFNVVVKVSQGFDTRRAEQFSTLADIIGSNPVMMTWFGDLLFRASDWPGHQELEERAKTMLAPPIQQAIAQKSQNGGMPPAAQAMISQLQQQLDQAHQLLQTAQQEIATKTAAAQVQLQIAQLNADKEFRLQAMKDASAISVAKINALTKGIISDNEAEVERIALAAEADRTTAQFGHEASVQARDHVHEAVQAHLDRQHEAVTGTIAQAADSVESQSQREHEMALAEMQPGPEAEGETEPS